MWPIGVRLDGLDLTGVGNHIVLRECACVVLCNRKKNSDMSLHDQLDC
jgi:hypothetical protein